MLLADFDFTDPKNIVFLIFAIAFAIVILLVAREINLWYWKIDESIKIQKQQLTYLKKMAGEEEVATEEITETTPWECIKCGHKNPNTTYQCENCDYLMK